MNKWLVLGICGAVGAAVGVLVGEWISPSYWLKLVIVALGGAIGSGVGSWLVAR